MIKKKTKELPKVEPVKIKPLFGLKPGLWLTIAYGLAILVIIFVVALLPDIIDGHKRITFTSNAGTAAVYLDGVYQGGTPFTRSVKSGTYQVSYQVNGVEIDSFTLKVGHPVFLNWLFPRVQKVESTAVLNDEAFAALTKELLEDASAYSAVLEYDTAHRYPEIFSQYAQSILSSSHAQDSKAFEAALLYVTTDEMGDDSVNATATIGINLITPYEILKSGKGSTVGIADSATPVVTATATQLDAGSFAIDGYTISAADFSNGRVVDSSYPAVLEAGVQVHTDAFNISTYCITEAQYSAFMAQNPYWSRDNKDALVSAGLVDEYYLDGVDFSTATAARPVRNISWHAASAFCGWLSGVTGRNVSLPTENQWIAASLTDTEGGYQKSLMPSASEGSPAAMLGGVWEMTSTRLIPLSRIVADFQVERANGIMDSYGIQNDMVVKGGSYVNTAGSVDRYTVGATARYFCSPYMGFRIVWN